VPWLRCGSLGRRNCVIAKHISKCHTLLVRGGEARPITEVPESAFSGKSLKQQGVRNAADFTESPDRRTGKTIFGTSAIGLSLFATYLI
jgi:hypothetical protein